MSSSAGLVASVIVFIQSSNKASHNWRDVSLFYHVTYMKWTKGWVCLIREFNHKIHHILLDLWSRIYGIFLWNFVFNRNRIIKFALIFNFFRTLQNFLNDFSHKAISLGFSSRKQILNLNFFCNMIFIINEWQLVIIYNKGGEKKWKKYICRHFQLKITLPYIL